MAIVRTSVALEQLIALELGSSIQTSTGQRLGFVSQAEPPLSQARLVVYDAERAQLGEVCCGQAGYQLLCAGQAPQGFPSLEQALGAVFEAGELRVVPPLPRPPASETSP